MRQWRHLECVGATLAHLAGLLGAARYLESYQRDLKTLPPQQAPMGAGVAGKSSAIQLDPQRLAECEQERHPRHPRQIPMSLKPAITVEALVGALANLD